MKEFESEVRPERYVDFYAKPEKRPRKPRRPRRMRAGTKAAMLRRADKLWSEIVRSRGICEVRRWYPHECKGGHQAMHGIPRTYKSTRWMTSNGFCGCAGAHLYLTWHPEEWARYLVKAWGPEMFENMWVTARRLGKPDAALILADLEQQSTIR